MIALLKRTEGASIEELTGATAWLPDTTRAALDKTIVKALARATAWYDELVSGRAASMREIAEREQVSERYVAQLLPLVLLKPHLIEGCVAGVLKLPITASDLAKGIALPAAWDAQEARYRAG